MRMNVNVESVRRYADCRAMTIGDQLNALRERSKMSLNDVAVRMGYRNASSIQRYFNSTYDPPALPNHLAKKLLKVLDGKGTPPICREEILAMCGLPIEPAREAGINFAAATTAAVARIASEDPFPEAILQNFDEILRELDVLAQANATIRNDRGHLETALRVLIAQHRGQKPSP